jgi:hypothetical protein
LALLVEIEAEQLVDELQAFIVFASNAIPAARAKPVPKDKSENITSKQTSGSALSVCLARMLITLILLYRRLSTIQDREFICFGYRRSEASRPV